LGRGAALAADATVDEIVGILIAVAPITGLARVVAAGHQRSPARSATTATGV
jgi:alkylhydroperoxidase/carboxymuconolactone decarboxylase family protein YurZ